MKRVLSILSLLGLFSMQGIAQDKNKELEVTKPARDFITLSFHYDTWMNAPEDVRITGFGRGFSAHFAYDFPIKSSNFSFAPGLGINTSNIYFDKQILNLNQTGTSIQFIDIDVDDNGALYKSSKYNYTYLEAPLEFRYFGNKLNRNKGFKLSMGAKVGLLVGAKSRVKHVLSGPAVVEKVNSKRYLATWRLAPVVRIGWGNFSVFGSYQVTSLFNAGEGPAVYPLSVGISISGL